MKVELCNFSGQKIYPSKGKLYVRGDSKVSPITSPSQTFISIRLLFQVFRFISSKSESLFLQRKNPRKISWTVVYRRMHKKGLAEEVAKKRSRKNVKAQVSTLPPRALAFADG
jgi:large subunit ribosomal protein L24e